MHAQDEELDQWDELSNIACHEDERTAIRAAAKAMHGNNHSAQQLFSNSAEIEKQLCSRGRAYDAMLCMMLQNICEAFAKACVDQNLYALVNDASQQVIEKFGNYRPIKTTHPLYILCLARIGLERNPEECDKKYLKRSRNRANNRAAALRECILRGTELVNVGDYLKSNGIDRLAEEFSRRKDINAPNNHASSQSKSRKTKRKNIETHKNMTNDGSCDDTDSIISFIENLAGEKYRDLLKNLVQKNQGFSLIIKCTSDGRYSVSKIEPVKVRDESSESQVLAPTARSDALPSRKLQRRVPNNRPAKTRVQPP